MLQLKKKCAFGMADREPVVKIDNLSRKDLPPPLPASKSHYRPLS